MLYKSLNNRRRTGIKWKPETAAEMQSSLEVSERFDAHLGFFSFKLFQVVECVVVCVFCTNLAELRY